MRLIDADALLEDIGEEPMNWTNSPEEIQEYIDWKRTVAIINDAPTIDEPDNRNEPIKPTREVGLYSQYFRCKKCDTLLVVQKQKYCFECGQAVKW